MNWANASSGRFLTGTGFQLSWIAPWSKTHTGPSGRASASGQHKLSHASRLFTGATELPLRAGERPSPTKSWRCLGASWSLDVSQRRWNWHVLTLVHILWSSKPFLSLKVECRIEDKKTWQHQPKALARPSSCRLYVDHCRAQRISFKPSRMICCKAVCAYHVGQYLVQICPTRLYNLYMTWWPHMATYPSVVCFSQQSCKTSVQTNFYSIVPMTSYAKLISLQPSAAKETSYVEMGSERRCVACAAGVSGANQRQGWSLQRIASGSTLVQQPGSRTPSTFLIVI